MQPRLGWKWQLYVGAAKEPGKLRGIAGHGLYFSLRLEQLLMLGWSRNSGGFKAPKISGGC